MSWAVTYHSLEAFTNDASDNAYGDVEDAVIDAARNAAGAILDSGVVGVAKGKDKVDFTIQLSGHSNPGHVPTPNMANDFITVTVTQNVRPGS